MMTLNDFITLKELLGGLRSEIDADYALRIEAIGWPGSRDVYFEAQEALKAVDVVIELAETYKALPVPPGDRLNMPMKSAATGANPK